MHIVLVRGFYEYTEQSIDEQYLWTLLPNAIAWCCEELDTDDKTDVIWEIPVICVFLGDKGGSR